MKANFSTTLNNIVSRESLLYKTYSFFRWDLWYFFSNIWKFRKELYNHRWWDYTFTLQMLHRSISIMEKGMHGGLEVKESRDKKIQKMQRVIELLKNTIDDNSIELAEKELGYELVMRDFLFNEIDKTDSNGEKLYELADLDTDDEKAANKKLFERARAIEEAQWSEIWEILKGQDIKDYSNTISQIKQETPTDGSEDYDHYNNWFDGTGLKGWWD